jgi:hypothetical protein
MSRMFLADEDEVPLPPKEVRIVAANAQPAPDGRRAALHITLTPFLEYPDLEIVLYRPDGAEERRLTVIGTPDRSLRLTLHVKQPQTGDYRAHIALLYDGEVLQTRDVVFSLLTG